jgi:hypothetical protein
MGYVPCSWLAAFAGELGLVTSRRVTRARTSRPRPIARAACRRSGSSASRDRSRSSKPKIPNRCSVPFTTSPRFQPRLRCVAVTSGKGKRHAEIAEHSAPGRRIRCVLSGTRRSRPARLVNEGGGRETRPVGNGIFERPRVTNLRPRVCAYLLGVMPSGVAAWSRTGSARTASTGGSVPAAPPAAARGPRLTASARGRGAEDPRSSADSFAIAS